MQQQFPQPPVPIFYPKGCLPRTVRGDGYIRFGGNETFISHVLVGKPVKIEQNKKALDIYYDKKPIKSVTYVSG